MVQLSHPYMTTGKTIDLTIWTFVSKVNGNISIYKESYFKSFAWYSVKMVKTPNLSMDWKFYKTLPNRDREGEREREKEKRKEGEKNATLLKTDSKMWSISLLFTFKDLACIKIKNICICVMHISVPESL